MSGPKATFAAILFVAAGIAVSGCGRGTRTQVGAVTVLKPLLCIGRAAAAGTCFTASSSTRFTSSLRVGECVQFSFDGNDSSGPARLTSVHPVPAAAHRDECPQ